MAGNGKPADEVRYLERQWADGRPLKAIAADMAGLGWSSGEVDTHLARIAGPRNPARAATPNDEGKQGHGRET